MLGGLELMVFLAVVRLGEGAYGAAILDELEARTGRPVTRGSVYVTLDRLVRKGLLDSRQGAPTPVRGGRAKRFFKPRKAGLAELRETLHALGRLGEGLAPLLEPS
jgi:DNA-binding PadR family transcriptional regulator